MGIKSFSKCFTPVRIVKIRDMTGQTIAIDAMTEIYRAALGAASVNTLTDQAGNPTLHINVILANIFEFHRQGVNQIWVFDYNGIHNTNKLEELEKRKKRRMDARKKLDDMLLEETKEKLFSDNEDETSEQTESTKQPDQGSDLTKLISKDSLQKRLFTVSEEMINDIKLILNALNIRYVEAPRAFEGEAIAAYLTTNGTATAVYSGDVDPIPFGANILYKKNSFDKKIYEYTRTNILEQLTEAGIEDADTDTLLKVCVALGSDFAEKTNGIGPKTVLKKLDSIELSEKQKSAIEHFKKRPSPNEIVIQNADKTAFHDCKYRLLLDWLCEEKNFSKTRMINLFYSVIPDMELSDEERGALKKPKKVTKPNLKKGLKQVTKKPITKKGVSPKSSTTKS